MLRLNTYYTAIVAILLLPACNQVSKSFYNTFHGRPEKSKSDLFMPVNDEPDGGNFLADRQRLLKAENTLKNLPEFKNKPIQLYGDMHMYDDGRIMLTAQDPDTLTHINAYEYSRNGEWGTGQPVKLAGTATAGAINNNFTPLNSLHFITVAKMAKTYADSTRHLGSSTSINHIYYVPEVQEWYCNDIETPRANYEIYFNPNGTVKEFRRE